MIITEYYDTRPDGIILDRTYSDSNMKIKQIDTDIVYDEAIDPRPIKRTYIETDIPIETEIMKDIERNL